jgi:hypothetical protein
MILGALVDAGCPVAALEKALRTLDVGGWRLRHARSSGAGPRHAPRRGHRPGGAPALATCWRRSSGAAVGRHPARDGDPRAVARPRRACIASRWRRPLPEVGARHLVDVGGRRARGPRHRRGPRLGAPARRGVGRHGPRAPAGPGPRHRRVAARVRGLRQRRAGGAGDADRGRDPHHARQRGAPARHAAPGPGVGGGDAELAIPNLLRVLLGRPRRRKAPTPRR